MQEMDLLGVRVEMPANAPMVLLRERDGGDDARTVPIFIGAPEATAITPQWTSSFEPTVGYSRRFCRPVSPPAG